MNKKIDLDDLNSFEKEVLKILITESLVVGASIVIVSGAKL
jgi:hypothetical protein